MIKSVEQETIKAILQAGLKNHTISEQEMEEALSMTTWTELQPILNKAQGVDPLDPAEELKLARAEKPLHREDFSEEELEKLKALAPEEYELLK